MDTVIYTSLIDKLRENKLSKDKFYILQNASSTYFFNGRQLFEIALCFPHSTDKKEAVAMLTERLCVDVSCSTAADIIKAASFSRDRLGILQVLVSHLSDITDQQKRKVVVGAFDFFIDKDEAWEIISKQCQASGATCSILPDVSDDSEVAPPPVCFRMVSDAAAADKSQKITVFELPIINELRHFHPDMDLMREAVEKEVKRRREANQVFVIPSKVWSITANLRPGRRLVAPPPSILPSNRSQSADWTNKDDSDSSIRESIKRNSDCTITELSKNSEWRNSECNDDADWTNANSCKNSVEVPSNEDRSFRSNWENENERFSRSRSVGPRKSQSKVESERILSTTKEEGSGEPAPITEHLGITGIRYRARFHKTLPPSLRRKVPSGIVTSDLYAGAPHIYYSR